MVSSIQPPASTTTSQQRHNDVTLLCFPLLALTHSVFLQIQVINEFHCANLSGRYFVFELLQRKTLTDILGIEAAVTQGSSSFLQHVARHFCISGLNNMTAVLFTTRAAVSPTCWTLPETPTRRNISAATTRVHMTQESTEKDSFFPPEQHLFHLKNRKGHLVTKTSKDTTSVCLCQTL